MAGAPAQILAKAWGSRRQSAVPVDATATAEQHIEIEAVYSVSPAISGYAVYDLSGESVDIGIVAVVNASRGVSSALSLEHLEESGLRSMGSDLTVAGSDDFTGGSSMALRGPAVKLEAYSEAGYTIDVDQRLLGMFFSGSGPSLQLPDHEHSTVSGPDGSRECPCMLMRPNDSLTSQPGSYRFEIDRVARRALEPEPVSSPSMSRRYSARTARRNVARAS